MGQIIAVTSGKGGTGKTTLCAGVASCLAAEGKRVLCIDADVGLRNLDISLGMSQEAVIPFSAVMDGEYTLDDAPEHPEIPNLYLLTAPVSAVPEALSPEGFSRMVRQAGETFDFCLIDAPAGLGTGFQLAVRSADEAIVVCTADPASLRDASRVTDLMMLHTQARIRLVVNRVSNRLFGRLGATVDDVMDQVGLPLLGIVPEDVQVTLAAAQGRALVLQSQKGAAVACLHIARRLSDKKIPLMRVK